MNLLDAAEAVRAIVLEAERPVKRMTMAEWERMLHYTCSMPTAPRPGFVYATGPHKRGSDPTTDPWWYVEVRDSDKPGYVVHVPTRILIEDTAGAPTESRECGRVGVGRGTDVWDPVCDRPEGHDGPCNWTGEPAESREGERP